MKKMILPIVLVMLLGWVLVGCGDKEFDPSLPSDLNDHLGTKKSIVKLPKDTNFHDWYGGGSAGYTYIAWSDADETKWLDYCKEYSVTSQTLQINSRASEIPDARLKFKADITSKFTGNNAVSRAEIHYYDVGGVIDSTDLEIPSGSIILFYKN